MAGSPRIIARPTTRSPAPCRRARVRQGQAFGGAEEAPSLTAAARDGDGNMRSGRENACGAGRTKEFGPLPFRSTRAGRGKPAEDLLQGHPDSEKAAAAARWAVDLKADRQFGGGAERARNLDAGNAGIAVRAGVLH